MADITSPTIISGFLKKKWTDSSIYSVYSYRSIPKTEDKNEELCFAIFYSPENDMNQSWMRDVRLLFENGKLTDKGKEFIKSNWRVSVVTRHDELTRTLYRNDNGDWIFWGLQPIGEDNEHIPEEKWPLKSPEEFYSVMKSLHSDKNVPISDKKPWWKFW